MPAGSQALNDNEGRHAALGVWPRSSGCVAQISASSLTHA
ncbi:hypothetical protein DB30_04425 [Enhygromyxa salina]|uniref:Uncharacterized protein n=1 Tax=Enhygromyxa salina TaxID=215803 RepID=A0A0C2D954_9BACT|nr:hypothetical protein DB30_04425 [Enhygromyxa salina]